MITISVKSDTADAIKNLNDIQRRQVPFATSLALNNTAKDVQQALTDATSVFDRPRPKTKNGTYLKRSDKINLTAEVGLKQRASGVPVDEYLAAEVKGGVRQLKRSELLLQRAGILPPGYQTRPGSGARLDSYGNMSRGQIVQILSYFKSFGSIQQSGRGRGLTQSAKLNRGAKRSAIEYFVVPPGMPGLATGIWQRKGRNIAPVLIFIRPPTYRKRYDFYGIAKRTANDRYLKNFNDALERALATAR